jgi:hypothetical protein
VLVSPACALESLGPAARAALPALGRARHDGDPSVEAAARDAILWIASPEFAQGGGE